MHVNHKADYRLKEMFSGTSYMNTPIAEINWNRDQIFKMNKTHLFKISINLPQWWVIKVQSEGFFIHEVQLVVVSV